MPAEHSVVLRIRISYTVLCYFSGSLENAGEQDKDTLNSHHIFLGKRSNNLRDYNSSYRMGRKAILPV